MAETQTLADLGAEVRGLADLLTVNAFEPDVRRDGSPRLVDGAATSEDVESLAIEGRDTAALLEKFLQSQNAVQFVYSACRFHVERHRKTYQNARPVSTTLFV